MTVEELARTLREIEVSEFMCDDELEHESYEELPAEVKEIYEKYAEAYLKYFDMEKKV